MLSSAPSTPIGLPLAAADQSPGPASPQAGEAAGFAQALAVAAESRSAAPNGQARGLPLPNAALTAAEAPVGADGPGVATAADAADADSATAIASEPPQGEPGSTLLDWLATLPLPPLPPPAPLAAPASPAPPRDLSRALAQGADASALPAAAAGGPPPDTRQPVATTAAGALLPAAIRPTAATPLQAAAAAPRAVRAAVDAAVDSPGSAAAAAMPAPGRLSSSVDAVPPLPALPGSWNVATAQAPAASTEVAQAEVQAPVGSKDFAPALGAQLSVLVRDGIEHAQLKLNPAELGPIDVRIQIDGSQTQVDFSAVQAQTRQALQEALPALASALREQGLTLSGGGVFEQPRDARGDTPQQDRAATAAPGSDRGADAALPAAAPRLPRARGVLDLYA